MPVIRGKSLYKKLSPEVYTDLLEKFTAEMKGQGSTTGPTIYEIPLQQSNLIDVMAVWNAFQDVSEDDRSRMIEEAYKDSGLRISQSFGLTYQEAIHQQALLYAVRLEDQSTTIDTEQLALAFLREGAFRVENGKLDLRFPTRGMAEESRRRMKDQFPQGAWAVSESSVFDEFND